MKKLTIYLTIPFTVIICLYSVSLHGQINAGEDITISAGLPVTLQGQYTGYIGIPVTARDDYIVGPYNIGFDFTYFDETFTQFAIGPNGLLTFNVPDLIDFAYWINEAIPNNVFEKTIMGPYQDLFQRPISEHNEYIFYRTAGTAPNRKLIVGWCEAPMFGCESEKATLQIVLNEEDQSIVNHLIAKPACEANLGNRATQGLNLDDITGVAVPGRNNTSWTAFRETWLFEPNGPADYSVSEIDFEPEVIIPPGKIEYTWFKNSYPDGERVGREKALMVYPLESTRYFCEITLCSGLKYVDDVWVNTIPIPNAFRPESDIETNREFKVFAEPDDRISNYKMQIFNRWGQVIFESTDIYEGWDGTNNGQPCNQGVYVWIVIFTADDETVTNKGVVTLVR